MTNVTIIIRQPLERRPPIATLLNCLCKMGYRIVLICTEVQDKSKKQYEDNVNFKIITIPTYKLGIVNKIISWMMFRRKVFSFLKRNPEYYSKSILWIGSADAALALGKKLFKFNYIFHCFELYDAFPWYKRKLKKIMQNAKLNITPEDNRGAIFRSWYKLKETPITLPNKPFFHPQKRNLNIDNTIASQIIEKLKDKKIILYQGGIVKGRDVSQIAKAIEQIDDDWVLVLMGYTDRSRYLADLLKQYPKTVYIPPVPAPYHLQITSWARIGIVSYAFDDLNHVFCAPNKTWEYTGFGIPMLGNNVPGIMNDLKKYGSGEFINLQNDDVNEIIDAINRIDFNYNSYSKNTLTFYNSVDIYQIISHIIKEVDGKIAVSK
ncbi:hypothetical protein EZS27_017274 [termite gut metagenome]|uniref:Glycosyl transferase family 1 domain-containing protein n=1 Tax=termite gut metagenome TaxID=433724 RepID=A0A5J4RLH0_9ZZZZ